jgi:hypothetical protein
MLPEWQQIVNGLQQSEYGTRATNRRLLLRLRIAA